MAYTKHDPIKQRPDYVDTEVDLTYHDLLAKYNAIILQLAPSTLNSGLVAYYPFNGNANDSSSNSYNGVVFGATLINDRNNKTRSAYRFE